MAQEVADELTTARARRAEVAARMEQDGDDQAWYELVLARWDEWIHRLEARHGQRKTAVQADL